MQTTTKQIHIKATCENENRRFCIAEAKFDSLKKLISNLFPLANGTDFTVKYKDDENDLVTISSDDELLFAVNMFPTDILRIVVEFPKRTGLPDCAAPCKWQNKCDRRPDEKRCDWLATKRERVQAKLKTLEGADFQAKPGLFYKQEHLKKKLQNIDNKLACKENTGENKQGRCPRNFSGPEHRQNSCNWMAIKKEKIQARLKELEGTDFHENPGLFWKKEKLERKLQAIDAKLACTAENAGRNDCDRGRGKFGGRGRGYGRYCQNQTAPHCNQENFCDQKRSRLEAKKGRIQARLKEMESNASQAQPGCGDWRRESLKKKLEMIEAKLACIDTTKKAHETEGSPFVPTEPVPLAPVQVVPLQTTPGPINEKDETKRIRDALKFEKQQAVAHSHAKKLEYQTAKRAQGADQRKEDVAKLHEEYVKAQEIAFEKKKALGEFNAKTRASREAKN